MKNIEKFSRISKIWRIIKLFFLFSNFSSFNIISTLFLISIFSIFYPWVFPDIFYPWFLSESILIKITFFFFLSIVFMLILWTVKLISLKVSMFFYNENFEIISVESISVNSLGFLEKDKSFVHCKMIVFNKIDGKELEIETSFVISDSFLIKLLSYFWRENSLEKNIFLKKF